MRKVQLAVVVSLLLPVVAAAQPSAPVVTKTDVIYGRVEGSALLANIAYPDGPALKPAVISVHGGRWRAGNRADASSIKVTQWAEFGFFAMSIDYRLVGGSPAPAPFSTC
jgi:acetyl esterase/lipase